MPSCSVHHCVLFLLTLTLTTDPGAAAVFPIYAKLHQPVILPCEAQCSGRAKWSLDSNRDDVFARCDQTSCTSVQQGFNMSHDKFKRGDLSLIITNPDYSMRKTYTCECEFSDYATARLRISPVFSAVPVQTEGDLKLDLTVPESVEVIYRRSDSADGVQICNVTDRTLECNTEYTPRTSLSNSELTLRDLWPWESGTYTIRNLDHEEDIRVYAVSVSAVSSAVQMRPGEDLKLDLSVPESVKVIYRGSDSADGVQICTVTDRTLQCHTEYTPRTSVSNSELTLRNMWRSESGTYTIRDTENNRDICVYAVSVSGLTTGETAGIVISVLFLVLLIAGLVYYMWRKAEREKEETERKRREVKIIMKELNHLMNQTVHLDLLEQKINDLQQKYRDDSEHSKPVMLFCNSKREYLRLYREVFITGNTSLQPVAEEVKTVMNEVDDLIKEAEDKPGEKQGEEMRKVLQKITDAELKSNRTRGYYRDITLFCNIKRTELEYCREIYETQKETTETQRKEQEKVMDEVDDLIQKVLNTPSGEEQDKALEDAEDKIYDVQQKYRVLKQYCSNKREELGLCRMINVTQKRSLKHGTGEVINEIKAVYELIREYKHRPAVEVKKKIDDLEKKSRENSKYYSRVKSLWNQKRTDLELCSRLGLLELEFNSSNTEKDMEELMNTFDELKFIADQNGKVTPELLYRMYLRVSSSLEWINKWCREQRDSLQKFKQQPSLGETDNKMICDVERHLRGLELWCGGKEYDLQMYYRKLKQRGGEISNAAPQTSRSEGGENTALLQV